MNKPYPALRLEILAAAAAAAPQTKKFLRFLFNLFEKPVSYTHFWNLIFSKKTKKKKNNTPSFRPISGLVANSVLLKKK